MKEFGNLEVQEAQVAAQIEERKGEVFRRDLYEKVKTVAMFLGKERASDSLTQGGDYLGKSKSYKFNTRTLRIECFRNELDDKSGSESVTVHENKIIRGHCLFWMQTHFDPKRAERAAAKIEINNYIPGEWEIELDRLYTGAIIIRGEQQKPLEEKEKQERLKKLSELKRRFGL